MAAVTGYSTKDVTQLLALRPGQLRSWIRAGFIAPRRGPRNEYRFSFQDLVLLRTAQSLVAQRIPGARVRQALSRLEAQLPRGRPLTGVQIRVDGDQLVVQDGDHRWDPESGQTEFDFCVRELARRVEPLALGQVESSSHEEVRDAEDWFELGLELEGLAPAQCRDAFRRCLELDPEHVEARLNIGRLLMEDGVMVAAEAHFRIAETVAPRDPSAPIHRGVVLEAMARFEAAAAAFRRCLANDPGATDAILALRRVEQRVDSTS